MYRPKMISSSVLNDANLSVNYEDDGLVGCVS